MNRIFKLLIIYTCLFYTGIIVAEPLVKLITLPCDSDRKEVFTSGYLGFPNPLESDKARLFLTIDDFKFNNFDQSIIVTIPENISYKRELFANKFVNIRGKYDCSIGSHGNFGSGGFKSVTEVVLAHENPDFNLKNFSKGLIKEVKSKKIAKFGRSIISKLSENNPKNSLYKFLFKDTNLNNIKIERLNWIFNNYLDDINSEKYRLCKIYEYEAQEYQDSHGITDGLICYSKGSCKFLENKYAENLPDWSSNGNGLCFSFESEKNETKLSLSQFY